MALKRKQAFQEVEMYKRMRKFAQEVPQENSILWAVANWCGHMGRLEYHLGARSLPLEEQVPGGAGSGVIWLSKFTPGCC